MKVSILHLSDLHRDLENEVDNTTLIESIKRDIDRFHLGSPQIQLPNICVISGDLIYGVQIGRGAFANEIERQYDQTLEFLTQLTPDLFSGNPENVVLIPGNHDICANTYRASVIPVPTPADSTDRRKLVSELFRPHSPIRWSWRDLSFYKIVSPEIYDNRLQGFCRCYNAFYGSKRTYSVNPREQFDIFEFSKLPLVIAGISSCFENDLDNRAGGICPQAISTLARELRNPKYDGILIGATWHHSIFGGPRQDDFLDADVLQSLIDVGISFGMSGHQHRSSFLDEYMKVGPSSRKLSILSASTLCAGPGQLSPGEPRGYNVIEIDLKSLDGKLHQRRMLNQQFELPVWGPGSFVESGASFIDFRVEPPRGIQIRNRLLNTDLQAAERLVGDGSWAEAIAILEDDAENALARSLLLKAVTSSEDFPKMQALFIPPRTVQEAIAAGGALVEHFNSDGAALFLASELVRTSTDPNVGEITTRVKRRYNR